MRVGLAAKSVVPQILVSPGLGWFLEAYLLQGRMVQISVGGSGCVVVGFLVFVADESTMRDPQ